MSNDKFEDRFERYVRNLSAVYLIVLAVVVSVVLVCAGTAVYAVIKLVN